MLKPLPPQPPYMRMIFDQDIYRPGEDVKVWIILVHFTPWDMAITYLPSEIAIKRFEERTRQRKLVWVIPGSKEKKELRYGEVFHWTVNWDQTDMEGKQVPGGWYLFETTFVTSSVPGVGEHQYNQSMEIIEELFEEG